MTGHTNLHHLAMAALLGVAPAPALAADPPFDSTAAARILIPLTVQKIDDLDFGSVIVTGAGTVVLNPVNDAVTTTGGVLAAGGSPHAARFIGAASENAVVNIRLPNQPVTLTRVGGTQTVTLNRLTLDSPSRRTMARMVAFEFKVGGTVNITANQAEGVYVGNFTVTVQYP